MCNSKEEKTFVIFTDLDDTLLDRNYSAGEAKSVLNILNEKNIPVIFCTAKTKTEQEIIRKNLGINHPFIVENGSAIFIPKNYFGELKGNLIGDYEVIILGVKAEEINQEIDKLRNNYKIKGYHNMSAEEISRITGLDLESAKRAMKRDFGETVVDANEEALGELKKKFNVVRGGRFIQVFGKGADKGKAVKILSNLYRESKQIITMGIGNAQNDEPMLRAVDIPTIVKNPDGNWADLKIDNIYRVNGIGPVGWVEAVKKFVLEE
jgi:mannosyl-3-phosphoglycerate phosphatase